MTAAPATSHDDPAHNDRGAGAPGADAFDLRRYDVETLCRRRGLKWGREGSSGIIAAWVADMDFPLAPAIHEALERAISDDDLGYPSDELTAAVRECFSHRVAERYGLAVDPDAAVLTSDLLQGISLALLTLTEPGDGVVFLTPAYPPYFAIVSGAGRRQVTCELAVGDRGYAIDFDLLRRTIARERPRCLLLCNPHNPVGRAFTRDELLTLAEVAAESDLVVLSDEVHADLTLPGADHTAFAALGDEIAARAVTFYSASKPFNLAGLRCAVTALGSPALAARYSAFPALARGGVNVLGLLAALAAWTSGDAWLQAVIAELEGNRGVLDRFVRSRSGEVAWFPPEATYLAWLDFAGAALGPDPAAFFHREAGVALVPGPDFGPSGTGRARLNFATPRPVLEQLLDRIGSALDRRH